MKCAEAEKLIALDVEGDLAIARPATLRGHLASCPACEEFAQEMRESQQALKSLRHEMPQDSLLLGARQGALSQLRGRRETIGWGRALWPRLRWIYATAGLAMFAWAMTGWMALQRHEAPAPFADAEGVRNQETITEVAEPHMPAVSSSQKLPAERNRAGAEAKRAEHVLAAQRPITAGAQHPKPRASNPALSAVPVESTSSVAPAPPRVKIVSAGLAEDSPDLDSGTTLLKIASNDPNVLLYWVMDSQGGS